MTISHHNSNSLSSPFEIKVSEASEASEGRRGFRHISNVVIVVQVKWNYYITPNIFIFMDQMGIENPSNSLFLSQDIADHRSFSYYPYMKKIDKVLFMDLAGRFNKGLEI